MRVFFSVTSFPVLCSSGISPDTTDRRSLKNLSRRTSSFSRESTSITLRSNISRYSSRGYPGIYSLRGVLATRNTTSEIMNTEKRLTTVNTFTGDSLKVHTDCREVSLYKISRYLSRSIAAHFFLFFVSAISVFRKPQN